jgi:hypothetical protein
VTLASFGVLSELSCCPAVLLTDLSFSSDASYRGAPAVAQGSGYRRQTGLLTVFENCPSAHTACQRPARSRTAAAEDVLAAPDPPNLSDRANSALSGCCAQIRSFWPQRSLTHFD